MVLLVGCVCSTLLERTTWGEEAGGVAAVGVFICPAVVSCAVGQQPGVLWSPAEYFCLTLHNSAFRRNMTYLSHCILRGTESVAQSVRLGRKLRTLGQVFGPEKTKVVCGHCWDGWGVGLAACTAEQHPLCHSFISSRSGVHF